MLLHSPISFTSLFLCHAEVEPNDTCPPLPQIAFGWNSLSHSSPVRSSVMTYQCQPGYDIIGTDVITCQWDLSWNGNPPTCVKGVTNSGTLFFNFCQKQSVQLSVSRCWYSSAVGVKIFSKESLDTWNQLLGSLAQQKEWTLGGYS